MMANPVPETPQEEAKSGSQKAIISDGGRSDYPNQVNNKPISFSLSSSFMAAFSDCSVISPQR